MARTVSVITRAPIFASDLLICAVRVAVFGDESSVVALRAAGCIQIERDNAAAAGYRRLTTLRLGGLRLLGDRRGRRRDHLQFTHQS
jgi:hypothetical protein